MQPKLFRQYCSKYLACSNATKPTALQSPIQLQTASLVEVKPASALDFIAPGMFTFASIFLIMMVAQSFTQDRENGMMKRIRISPNNTIRVHGKPSLSLHGHRLNPSSTRLRNDLRYGIQTNRRHSQPTHSRSYWCWCSRCLT